MKYCTYNLKWENDYGTDPTKFNSEDVAFEPAFNDKPLDIANAKIYAYWIKGTVDPSLLSEYNFQEITLQEMYEAAKLLDSDCWIEDNIIKFPIPIQ